MLGRANKQEPFTEGDECFSRIIWLFLSIS